MSEFLWLLLTAGACLWSACLAAVSLLGMGLRGRDPRVVTNDPFELAAQGLAWDRLREAVRQASTDLAREDTDFSSWEREVKGPRSHRAA